MDFFYIYGICSFAKIGLKSFLDFHFFAWKLLINDNNVKYDDTAGDNKINNINNIDIAIIARNIMVNNLLIQAICVCIFSISIFLI